MKATRLLWRLAGTIGLAASLLFLFGFGYAVKELTAPGASSAQPPPVATLPAPSTQPPSAKDKLQIVAVGDSLTHGVGDEAGKMGYAGRVRELLEKQTGRQVGLSDNGRDGYKTADLLAFLQQPGIDSLLQGADIVLVTIGGNDLNQFGLTLPGAAAGQQQAQVQQDVPDINYAEVAKRMPEAEARLEQVLKRLHDLNPKAQIVYVGLYNPYIQLDPNGDGAKLLQAWNLQAFAIASRYPNMFVVPTYDLFQKNEERYLFVDHFHPNAAGYDRIAERVFQVLQ